MRSGRYLVPALLVLTLLNPLMAQQMAIITGLNADAPNSFSFVLAEDFPGTANLYISSTGFDTATNQFPGAAGVFVWNPPAGGSLAGTVVIVDRLSGTNLSPSVGTITRIQGTLGFGSTASLYLYYSEDPVNPHLAVTSIFSFIYTQNTIPITIDPVQDANCNCTPIDVGYINFPVGSNDGVEYSPMLADRTNTQIAALNSTINWNISTGLIPLDPQPFINIDINTDYAGVDYATVMEDSGMTDIQLLLNDRGFPSSVDSITQPENGTATINIDMDGIVYQPDENYCNDGAAPDDFSYMNDLGETARVSVSVTCVDDPADAVNDAFTVNEDSENTLVDVLMNDSDVEGDPFLITDVGTASDGMATIMVNASNDRVVYTPDPDYCNTSPTRGEPGTFDYGVTGGDRAIVVPTVLCINDEPSFTIIGNVDFGAGTGGSESLMGFVTSFDLGPGTEDMDQSLQQYILNEVSDPDNIVSGVSVSPGGTLMVDLSGVPGTATYEIQLMDDGGTDLGGDDTSQVQSFDITFSGGVDLAVMVDNNRATLRDGEMVDYTIVVSNNVAAQVNADSAVIDVMPPVELTGVSWTCVPGSDAACGNLMGMTQINEIIDVGFGGDVTYTLSATVSGVEDQDTVVLSGTATAPKGINETNITDNTGVDSDPIVGPDMFEDGFEDLPPRVQRVKVAELKDVVINPAGVNRLLPVLVAEGVDDRGRVTVLIHLRRLGNRLQIRQSFLGADALWVPGDWEDAR